MTDFESTLPRRSRAELEQLAADFVNSKIHVKASAPRMSVPKPALAGGGIVAAALLAWMLWPEGGAEVVRETPTQAAEAEAWAKRLEAERERKRKELQSSRDYLAKMAASDSALLADMTARAQALATRGSAEPPIADARTAEPTPRTEATTAPAPARSETAGAEPASKPDAAAPAAAPAASAPVQVAQADPASCRIHVSELSGSGKLTYADVTRMKGATTDARGHVFTPEVTAANGRKVVFEVMPTGCVRIARTRR